MNQITTADKTAKEIALNIVENLTGFARDEARVWSSNGKTRIYFGRQFVEIRSDLTVIRDGNNPYSVKGQIEEMGLIVR